MSTSKKHLSKMLYVKKVKLNNANDSLSQIADMIEKEAVVLDVGCACGGLATVLTRYVSLPLDGWQPHRLSELPSSIASFIAQDKHSKIMQYIMLCIPQNGAYKNNLKELELPELEMPRPTVISRLKRLIIIKCPRLIKYIEKLKK